MGIGMPDHDDSVDEACGEMENVMGDLEVALKKLDLNQIGFAVLSYIAESNHGGWDGFEPDHAAGMTALAKDLLMYTEQLKELGMKDLTLFFGGAESWDASGKRSTR